MAIKVLFFGATADAAGLREATLEIGSSTVETALSRLSELYPRLLSYKLLPAINEEYVDSNAVLREGDELAIFTAVSGG